MPYKDRLQNSQGSWVALVRLAVGPGQDREEHLEGAGADQLQLLLEAHERRAKAREKLDEAQSAMDVAAAQREIERFGQLIDEHTSLLQVLNSERDRFFADRRATFALVLSWMALVVSVGSVVANILISLLMKK